MHVWYLGKEAHNSGVSCLCKRGSSAGFWHVFASRWSLLQATRLGLTWQSFLKPASKLPTVQTARPSQSLIAWSIRLSVDAAAVNDDSQE